MNMKPVRTALFSVLFIYLALLVFASINFERAGNWMSTHPQVLPYFTLIGMGVFLLIFFLTVFERNHYHRTLAKKEAEKNEIKARVYEMQRRNDEVEKSLQSFENSVTRKEMQEKPPRETPKTPTKPNENL